jgi:hypothetical protein
MQLIEEKDEPKEVLDAVDDQSHVTIAINEDIMHGNAHFH